MHRRSITIKRSELYSKVWSIPLKHLSKEFGISDVALGKTCKRNNIPKPGLGYWAKLEHGKAVKKTALPESKDGDYEITITAFEKPEIRTEDSDSEQVEMADQLIRKINMDENPISASDSLDNAHKYVRMTYRSLKNARKNECNILIHKIQKCLPIHVSAATLDRALFIMDSLLSLLEKYSLSIDSECLDKIHILGHQISFSLNESLDRKEIELTDKERQDKELYSWMYNRPKYIYIPNGNLSLSINEECYPSGMRRSWSDNKKQKVERFVKKFLISAIEISVHKETLRRRNKRWEREREQERKRQAELSEKRWQEQKRVEELENEVSQWLKSQQIRSYVSYVHSEVTKKCGSIEKGSNLDRWMIWALRRADIIDPLVAINPESWEINFDKRASYW
jgi:hypothetical protein